VASLLWLLFVWATEPGGTLKRPREKDLLEEEGVGVVRYIGIKRTRA